MARTKHQLQSIGPQAGSAVGVSTYVNDVPSSGFDQLADSLALAYGSSKRRDQQREQEYANNVEYYASQFAKDREIGMVDATQVGKAYPDASPIVAGKITELVGNRWGSDYARSRMDEFLADDQRRLDPVARQQFFEGLRNEVAEKVQGRAFFGNGAVKGVESLISEYESGFQREAAAYHQQVQEDDFVSNISGGLTFQPSTEAAGENAGLLDFIGGLESNGNYNAHYGNSNNRSVDFTSMTVDQVIDWQRKFVAGGSISSAVGRYQIVTDTMRWLKKSMGLTGNEIFSPELQDKMAVALLYRRGYGDYRAGLISKEEFANNLALEWASLPKVTGPGAGKSQYEGYAGNRSLTGVDSFLSVLEAPGERMDPVAKVDAEAGETTSINPIRRRELVVDTAIDLAIANRDTSVLDRIPSNMRGIPEVEAKIAAAEEQVRDLQWQDYTRQIQLDEHGQKQMVSAQRQDILNRIANGEDINPADYAQYGPDVYDYAVKVQDDEFIDPVASARAAANLRDTFLRGATTGDFGGLVEGDLSEEEAVRIIETQPGLTASDRLAMIEELPKLMEGMNLLNDPQIETFYNNYIGEDLKAYLASVEGGISRIQGQNISGAVRAAYDETIRSHIVAAIEDGEGIPRGARKREILAEARDEARKALERFQSRVLTPPEPKQEEAQPKSEDQASADTVSIPNEVAGIMQKYDVSVEPEERKFGDKASRSENEARISEIEDAETRLYLYGINDRDPQEAAELLDLMQ